MPPWSPPPPADAATACRSLVVTATTAALHLQDVPGLVTVGGHAADAGGRLLVPTSPDCRVLASVVVNGALPARAVLTDVAPLPVRSRIRGRLELCGTLASMPAGDEARSWELATGSALGRDRRILRLTPTAVALDAAPVALDAYARAAPDPLAAHEAEVLSHLATGHAAATAQLCGLLPRRLVAGAERVVPLRLDRHALVLRVERAGTCTDVPLALASVHAEHPGEVLAALRALLDTARRPAPRR